MTTTWGSGLVDDDPTGAQRGVRCPDRVNLIERYDYPKFARLHGSTEWDKGAEGAMGALMLDEQDVDEWVEQLLEGFALGAA